MTQSTTLDPKAMTEAQRATVQMVKSYVGCSLSNRAPELRLLISRGIDNPATIIYEGRSTCGLFVLGIWHALAVDHPLLAEPYQTGMAITWALRIAHDLGALRYPQRDGPPCPGAVMHYYTKQSYVAGNPNDHVEFCLSAPEVSTAHGGTPSEWIADHAGGGRSHCGVSEGGPDDILWNYGRPLQAWICPDALLELGQ